MADVTIIANGTGNINLDISKPGPLPITFSLTGNVQPCPISGTFSLPTQFTFTGDIKEVNHASLEAAIPAVEIYAAEGSGYLSESIPAITPYSMTARTDCFALLSSKLPVIRISAAASFNLQTYLYKSIPAIRIASSAHVDTHGSLTKPIPAIKITASAISGYSASLSKPIPAIELIANSYQSSGATLQKSIPAIKMSGRVVGTITFLSMNTHNSAVSTYNNYDFHNLCIFNGVTLGSKSDGIYDLSGEKDGTETIIWRVNTGLLDFKNANLRYLIVNGKLPSDLIAIVALPDGTEYEYRVETISDYEDELRIKVGKGLNDRYLSVELTNEDSAEVRLDSITLFGLKESVRR